MIGALGVLAGCCSAPRLQSGSTRRVEMPPPPGRSDIYPLAILSRHDLCRGCATGVTTCMSAAWFAARRGVRKPIVEALAYV